MKDWFAHKILGLPELASSNGQAVDNLMVYVHWLMLVLFVGWVTYFIYTVYRFSAKRSPKANYEGLKSSVPSYVEYLIIGIEAILLIFLRSLLSTPLGASDTPTLEGGTFELGKLLFTQYVLPFEIVSILLLVAIVGVVLLSKKELK